MADNPMAFPGGHPEAGYEPSYGMTLRDWFAGQALAGVYASQWFADHGRGTSDSMDENIANLVYSQADAMLAERKKNDG